MILRSLVLAVSALYFFPTLILGNPVQKYKGGYMHQFCANNQLFSFSSHECPGGVLLKKPMALTEPCHCINEHLTVYEACFPGKPLTDFDFPRKICRESSDKKMPPLIIALQPSHTFSRNVSMNPKCQKALSSCQQPQLQLQPINNFLLMTKQPIKEQHEKNVNSEQHEIIEIDANNQHSHFHVPRNIRHNRQHSHDHHRQKRDMSLLNVYDETLRARIQETINFLNELQLGPEDQQMKQPKSMSLQALTKTVEIFNHITPNAIVEDETMLGMLTLFLEKYSDLELPGISGNLAVDNLLDKRTFDEVMTKLEECSSKARDPNQEFQFISQEGSCPSYITHSVYKIDRGNYGTKKIKTELGKLLPDDRKYVPDVEDFILGALWKAFDAVYAYCFPYTFTFQSAQIFVNFHNIIENIFSFPSVYSTFISSDQQGTMAYSSRIDHDNLTLLMRNLEAMDEAVHIVSKSKHFFLKPLAKPQTSPAKVAAAASTDDKKNPSLKRSIVEQIPFNPDDNDNLANPFRRVKREKRSVVASPQNVDWKKYEIWNGQAYCLQLADPSAPPNLFNTYPNIENICSEHERFH